MWLFENPWTAARQASLFFTIAQSLLKRMSIESVMLSNHLILCHLLLLSVFPSIKGLCLFFFPQWVGSLHQVAKVLEFQLQHQSFQWIFRVDFLYDWLVWSPCCPRDSQESSATPQFENNSSLAHQLSHSYMTTGKAIALAIQTF